ncbi:MAG TPA: hypothetical protein DCM05_08100 [Elusimicrobia bacterium]|nr:hypothetical protein [Elusimicrobiota bacterium]
MSAIIFSMKKLLLPVLLLLCSCATHKWVFNLRQAEYLSEAQYEGLTLPPPPAPGSAIDQADLAALRGWQARRTRAQCRRAKAQFYATFDEFYGDLSPFQKPLPKDTLEILEQVHNDADIAVAVFKDKYARPRPFLRDEKLKPCIERVGGKAYPSGHAAVARVFALLLADAAPERKADFLARADEAALNRVIAGVHHPTDIEAGKGLADEVYAQMKLNPSFQADLEKLKASLKR